jgi:hypothetical protein
MMIMSMRLGYVSELQPPMIILFIPRMIYEYGEPWWNDISMGRLLIRPPEISVNTTSTVIE